MRERRHIGRRLAAAAAAALAAFAFRLLAKAIRRPVDSLAILGAVVASGVIIVNAAFLQSGSHAAPFFRNPSRPVATAEPHPPRAEPVAIKAAEPVAPSRPAAPPRTAPPAARRNDPIADLIGSSARVMAVQRALSEFGYGQIRPSGIVDEPTSTAIESFEREHKLPITGRVSDRLMSEVAVMVGHPLQ